MNTALQPMYEWKNILRAKAREEYFQAPKADLSSL
jgi:hypothetical protein